MKKVLLTLALMMMFLGSLTVFVAGCDEDEISTGDGDADGDDGSSVDGDTDGDSDSVGDEPGEEDNVTDGDEDALEEEIEDPVPAGHIEERGEFTILYLKGTPYQMGYQQGELLHDTITEAMEFVANDPILSSLPVLAQSMGILDIALENSYQEILDECQGMVDASEDTGFNMEFCLALNFGDVMLEFISNGIPDEKIGGPGCSSVFATGEASADGRSYYARNLDWGSMDISIIHEHPVIQVREPDGGIPHVVVGFPLNLTPYTGMNAEGLVGCSHEIDPVDQSQMSRSGRSHAQMLSRILTTATGLDDVRSFIADQKHMSSELLVFADGKSGEGAVFEMTATTQMERSPERGLYYATNHFLLEEMVDLDLPQDVEDPDSSIMREERFKQLVAPDGAETKFGSLNIETLAQVMKDRVNPRTGEEAGDDVVDNDAGISSNGPMHFTIFDPERKLFWVAAGSPPVHLKPYTCFSLGELLGDPEAVTCDGEEL